MYRLANSVSTSLSQSAVTPSSSTNMYVYKMVNWASPGFQPLIGGESPTYTHHPQWHIDIFTTLNKMLTLVPGKDPCGFWIPLYEQIRLLSKRVAFCLCRGNLHLLIRWLVRTLNFQALIFRGQSFYWLTWPWLRKDLRSQSLCLARRHSLEAGSTGQGEKRPENLKQSMMSLWSQTVLDDKELGWPLPLRAPKPLEFPRVTVGSSLLQVGPSDHTWVYANKTAPGGVPGSFRMELAESEKQLHD